MMSNHRLGFGIIKLSFLFLVASVWIFVAFQIAQAVGGYPAEALGVKTFNGAKDFRANIWTAQQPANFVYIRGLVAICLNNPCTNTSGAVETGYHKGTQSGCTSNQLQQYFAYRPIGGNIVVVCGLGNLNNDTWYQFSVRYNNSSGGWIARRDGVIVYTTNAPGFQSGNAVLCGAGGSAELPPLGVQCDTMQIRLNGTWTSIDYVDTEIRSNYCVYKPYDFALIGWGQC